MDAKTKLGNAPRAEVRLGDIRDQDICLNCIRGICFVECRMASQRTYPPSIFEYCTELPSPTTGMTRSLVLLREGDWRSFFLFNPLTSVYLALTGISAVILVKQRIQGKRLALPSFLAWSWLIALALGWLLKFAIGNKYW